MTCCPYFFDMAVSCAKFNSVRYFIFLLFLSVRVHAQSDTWEYPQALRDTVVDNYFNTKISDPYRWLENDTLESTQQWVQDELKLSNWYLNKVRKKYNQETQLKNNSFYTYGTRIKQGKYYFDFIRHSADDAPSLYIKKKIRQEATVVVDPVDYANGRRDRAKIAGFTVSNDSKYLAVRISHSGSDWNEIYVKSLFPFRRLDDVVTNVKFCDVQWGKDGFFYLRFPQTAQLLKDKNENPSVYYHKLGTLQAEDRLVFTDSIYAQNSIRFHSVDTGNYLVIYHWAGPKQYVLTLNIKDSLATKFDTLIATTNDCKYDVVGRYKNEFLVKTTQNTSNGKLILCSGRRKNAAEEFIPGYKEVLHDVAIVGNRVICTYLSDIDYVVFNFDTSGKMFHQIRFPIGSSIGDLESAVGDSVMLIDFYSFLHPPIVYQYNVNSTVTSLVEQTSITYDHTDFIMEKVVVYSKDSAKIPMIIARKKGLKLNGKNPTLLYGYGGYGKVTTPFFDPGFISFLQNGGVVALPCLRGGGEYGDDWHNEGSKVNKQNVFNDFIASAKYLFDNKYTCSQKLAIMGGSNGGLLVAAVANQRPDICKAVIAEKGIYDMLRYQHFTIGNGWRDEFGTSSNKFQFNYLKDYSPLHNINDTTYPAILVVTADHDDRVVPLHSYKYVAALQHTVKRENPVFLYQEKNAGHLGNRLETNIAIYSFLYDQLGVPQSKIAVAP
jgi:prolyl oligopeptidase